MGQSITAKLNALIIDDEISGLNARLIAAAPDLLAACNAAFADFGHFSNGSVQALEIAIRKAETE